MQNAVKSKGVVFTGKEICDFMSSFIELYDDRITTILEPSCGEGAFLESLLSFPVVKIHGNDINEDFVNTCKNNFGDKITLTNSDFINLSTKDKYDYVIGNPPYVRIQNLQKELIQQLKEEYPEYLTGNFDLYMYFILKGLDMLNDDGKLIYIVPNSLLYNKSCSKLKRYLFENGLVEYIIDFRDKKMFANYSTYTCIIVLNKKNSHQRNSYYINDAMNDNYKSVMYKDNEGVENTLLNYIDVKNGIATLADKVFIIKPKQETEQTYIVDDFEIEKDICKEILKVSKKTQITIIYPYDDGKVIPENVMKIRYPKCYEYLQSKKEILDNRDKGKKKYEAWYAYGRRQSLNISNGTRLFIPTLINNIKDNMIVNESPLFYSGLWIDIKETYKDTISIEDIQNTLIEVEKNILPKSNVKSQGWYSLCKTSFDVPCYL